MSQRDPRVERSLRVIGEAALAQLAEGGWDSVTIDAVATRAGVARSTVYRHWPDKKALLLDALDRRSVQPPPDDSPPGRPRVVALVRHLAEVMADPDQAAMAVALVDAAERDPEVRRRHHRFNNRRRAALSAALADAGVADPDLAAMALAGGVIYARMMRGRPLRRDQADALVTAVLGPA